MRREHRVRPGRCPSRRGGSRRYRRRDRAQPRRQKIHRLTGSRRLVRGNRTPIRMCRCDAATREANARHTRRDQELRSEGFHENRTRHRLEQRIRIRRLQLDCRPSDRRRFPR